MVGHCALITLVLTFSILGCKPRRSVDIDAAKNLGSGSAEQDLSSLRSERDRLISELREQKIAKSNEIADLTLERDELNTRRAAAEAEVSRIKDELATNKSLTETEKKELLQRLEKTEGELTTVKQRLDDNKQMLDKLL
jgi:hypothetical protein